MPAVTAAVDVFYTKILADEEVSHFFKDTNISAQSPKLKAFLAYAFGAPMQYSGKNMRDAHRHMQIDEKQFNAVAGHLVATLDELGVAQQLIGEVVDIAMSVKGDIMNN